MDGVLVSISIRFIVVALDEFVDMTEDAAEEATSLRSMYSDLPLELLRNDSRNLLDMLS